MTKNEKLMMVMLILKYMSQDDINVSHNLRVQISAFAYWVLKDVMDDDNKTKFPF